MGLRQSPFLRKGDRIGVISMASRLDKERYENGKLFIEQNWGLEIEEGQHLFAEHFNFAGTDEQRLSDLQAMLDNPEIKAIVAGRGGYGSSRIVDQIDWRGFQKQPKWLVGFSDITVMHQKIQSLGIQSIHGPMMVTLNNDAFSSDSLRAALFGEALSYTEKPHEFNRLGFAEGQIIGGNLCLLCHNVGSKSDLNFDGRILFIEDIDEYYYNIDRMMVQLKRAGKLDNLAGLLVGQFSNSRENGSYFGQDANEIIASHTAEFAYPLAFDFPIGHDKENRAIRCGELMELTVETNGVKLKTKE